MDRDEIKSIITLACVLAVVFAMLGGVWIFKSHMEAKSYNRVTGSDVTTWEAMWIELRVQSGPDRLPSDK